MDQQTEQCLHCPKFLKSIHSCPLKPNFSQSSFEEIFLDIIFVFCSTFYGYPYGFSQFFYSLFKKTTRHLHLIILLGVQFLTFEIAKMIIKQDRPALACKASVSNYGMPSGHCTFAFSYFTWYLLEVLFLNRNCLFKKSMFYRIERIGVLCLLPLMPFARLYLNYHTVEQVIVGSIIGCLIGAGLFFYLCKGVADPNSSYIKKLINKNFLNDYQIADSNKNTNKQKLQ